MQRELAHDRAVIKKMPQPSAPAELSRIDARIALREHDNATAIEKLSTSVQCFEAAGTRDEATRDRFALGVLKGGDEGAALQNRALEFLSELGVVAPPRQIGGYYPELFDHLRHPRREPGRGGSAPPPEHEAAAPHKSVNRVAKVVDNQQPAPPRPVC